jgi:hypothetical protein
MDYKIGALLGRLSNGFQSDHGIRYHAVVWKRIKRPPCPFNDWGRKEIPDDDFTAQVALCGAKPGRRSVGWDFQNGSSNVGKEVTCPRCLKKLQKGEKK